MAQSELPTFPVTADAFAATLASIAASQGDAAAVAVLTYSEPELRFTDSWSDFQEEVFSFTLRLILATEVYGRLTDSREYLSSLANEISRAHDPLMLVSRVVLAPSMNLTEGWRDEARRFLRTEGVNNQGRVRSDNPATRAHEGLYFRSEPEVHLFNALKKLGVYMAPLPVFVRGGAKCERLEPDFVLVHNGVMAIIEVDGATVHRESPVEAHERLSGLQRHGVRIERVKAADCSDRENAERCAKTLMQAIAQYGALRT